MAAGSENRSLQNEFQKGFFWKIAIAEIIVADALLLEPYISGAEEIS